MAENCQPLSDRLKREACPTCGGAVVVHSSNEGTSHYVPAERDRLRASAVDLQNRVLELAREAHDLRAENEVLKTRLAAVDVPCGCQRTCGDDGDIDGPGTCKDLPVVREPLVEIVMVPRSRRASDDKRRACETCAGSGAQLCECDKGERPIHTCFSCSGRKCAACGGSGQSRETEARK